MPGNVPGAGIHEVCAALLAGAGLIIKSASSEPLFFANFMRTLAEVDAAVAARVAVVNFGRGRRCRDARVVGLPAMEASSPTATTPPSRRSRAAARRRGARPLAGFGSRLSGALVAVGASPSAADAAADGLARDVTLFEQRGCLSPHHVFVVGGAGEARGFAARLARALERLARRLPAPARLPLDAAAAIRALRERARWRALAQRSDGLRPRRRAVGGWRVVAVRPARRRATCRMTWTVIYDGAATFCASPGYRTVFVSALERADELGERLGAAAGRLEAFALAAPPDFRVRLRRRFAAARRVIRVRAGADAIAAA